jgi:hypothetical protein
MVALRESSSMASMEMRGKLKEGLVREYFGAGKYKT